MGITKDGIQVWVFSWDTGNIVGDIMRERDIRYQQVPAICLPCVHFVNPGYVGARPTAPVCGAGMTWPLKVPTVCVEWTPIAAMECDGEDRHSPAHKPSH